MLAVVILLSVTEPDAMVAVAREDLVVMNLGRGGGLLCDCEPRDPSSWRRRRFLSELELESGSSAFDG